MRGNVPHFSITATKDGETMKFSTIKEFAEYIGAAEITVRIYLSNSKKHKNEIKGWKFKKVKIQKKTPRQQISEIMTSGKTMKEIEDTLEGLLLKRGLK